MRIFSGHASRCEVERSGFQGDTQTNGRGVGAHVRNVRVGDGVVQQSSGTTNEKAGNPLTEKRLTEEERKKGQGFLASLDDWYRAMRRLAKRALCSCVDQPYDDMTDFLLGYADGFSRKPRTFQVGNIGKPNANGASDIPCCQPLPRDSNRCCRQTPLGNWRKTLPIPMGNRCRFLPGGDRNRCICSAGGAN